MISCQLFNVSIGQVDSSVGRILYFCVMNYLIILVGHLRKKIYIHFPFVFYWSALFKSSERNGGVEQISG